MTAAKQRQALAKAYLRGAKDMRQRAAVRAKASPRAETSSGYSIGMAILGLPLEPCLTCRDTGRCFIEGYEVGCPDCYDSCHLEPGYQETRQMWFDAPRSY